MRYRIFIFLFFIVQSNYCQDILVTYNVSDTEIYSTNRPDTLPLSVKKVFEEAKKNFKLIEYTLYAKNSESLFFMNEIMFNEANDQMRVALALAGPQGRFYTNSEQDIKLRELNTYGQDFLVNSNFDAIVWETTSESKTILDFTTYKATGSEMYETGNGMKMRKITAWYAPAIEKPFGPLGYGNLPGLILELSMNGKTFKAEEVQYLELKPETIKKPTEGKKVSKKEFQEIGRKMHSRMIGS